MVRDLPITTARRHVLTPLNELLFLERSASMIDGSEKRIPLIRLTSHVTQRRNNVEYMITRELETSLEFFLTT